MKSRTRRRFWFWSSLAAIAVVLGTIATVAVVRDRARRLRDGLSEARGAIASGRYNRARERLVELVVGWPGNGEALTLLGRCEEALGRPEEALSAWKTVATASPNFASAAESRGHLLIALGRYSEAEASLTSALGKVDGEGRARVLRALARLLRIEGRFADVGDALVAACPDAPDPHALLEELWANDTEFAPLQGWGIILDSADSSDDRLWLAKSRLAIRAGNVDEARSWLDRCLEHRPDDPEAWRTRLDLALATDDAEGFWEAAGHVPAAGSQPWELAELRCRLAAKGGGPLAERRELVALLELRPSHGPALERLAELAILAGNGEEAEKLRRRKAELDEAKDRIQRIIKSGGSLSAHAREMAELSGALGRPFDHEAWSLVASGASAQGPDAERARAACRAAADEALARLESNLGGRTSPSGKTETLADRLADFRSSAAAPSVARTPSTASPDFVDDASTVGLEFTFHSGRSPLWLLPEILAGGIGVLDYDGDGWVDVYCVQGGSVELDDSGGGDRLFRNRGDGTFEDVTEGTGVGRLTQGKGLGQGVAVGDYDNDGRPDLFVTRLGSQGLFRNTVGGRFEDVTAPAGLLAGDRQNPTSAAFADLDNDGDLDLYVCHYAHWDPDSPPSCRTAKGGPFYCDPTRYEAAADRAYRNDAGVFVDVTEAAGFTDQDGRGLGVVAADIDDDGDIDLYVANDGTANFLFKNLGGFRFEEVGSIAGVASNAEGAFRAGMGVVAADLDADGKTDLLVTNLHGEGSTFYRNLGGGLFADHGGPSGVLQATRYLTGFGVVAFDATNAGRPFLATANGHVNDFRPLHPYAMPCRLLESRPGGRMVDVSDGAGAPWSVLRLGRGLASGDLDNDGRVDLVVVSQDEPLAYLHNRTERPGHFLTLRLEGTASNRDGVGARVSIVAGGLTQEAQRTGGGSYLSASDPRLHFGLGASDTVESVIVRWPSGQVDRHANLAADAGVLIREGDPNPGPLPGFSREKAAKEGP